MRAAPALNGAVIPPSPQVARDKMPRANALDMAVVPPAPTDTPRNGMIMRVPGVGSTNVVPPAVSTPERKTSMNANLFLPAPSVIAPPPARVTRESSSFDGAEMTDLRRQVVPPPVELRTESLTGRGRGAGGMGSVVPLDTGSVLAPPKGRGSSHKVGIVVSNQPGPRAGLPATGGSGSLAVSPAGSGKTGLGGNGLGNGIGRGSGPGSGMVGEATGAATAGTGRGSDPASHPGISPYAGPGGAGKEQSGLSATPGISVQGGNTPTIPSFEADGNGPTVPGHSGTSSPRDDIDIIVEGTARSGGGFNYYGKLPGQNYTKYIPTAIGPAVMQYADASSATHTYAQGLTAPETIKIDLPSGLRRVRIIIACILDRSGQLQDLRLLDWAAADGSAKVLLAALHSWKFIPARRGEEPVEVNAILGFNIDTR
jgi:hypothetical protein